MSYYSRNMPTQVTYFPPNGQDGFGEAQFKSAVSLKARWQVKNELVRNSEGREVVSKSVAYVNDLVEVGGRLALGNASDPSDGEEIISVGVSPSLDSQRELVKAWL